LVTTHPDGLARLALLVDRGRRRGKREHRNRNHDELHHVYTVFICLVTGKGRLGGERSGAGCK